MSLHDRIMALPLVAPYAGRDYEAGEMRNHASELARDADELINWCQAHLETLRQVADSAASFDEAKIALDRIKKFKEQTNERN